MGVYAGRDDLEKVLGQLSDAQIPHAEWLLEVAEAKVIQRIGSASLAARIVAGRTSTVLVRNVIVEMVAAVMRNPDGYRSTSSGEGPYTESRTFDARAAAGRLTLTRDQLYDLGERRGIRSVPVGDDALAEPVRTPDLDLSRVFLGWPVDSSQTP